LTNNQRPLIALHLRWINLMAFLARNMDGCVARWLGSA
jgi:hypothetical protein